MVTYLYILHCMDFSVNSRWWGEGEMMRPSVQGVDPPVCCTPGCYCYICKRQLCGFPQCAASWMTYARDSFVDSPSGAFCPLEGGGQTHWHQSYTTFLLSWYWYKMALKPRLLASVSITNRRAKFGYSSVGALVSFSLSCSKADWHRGDQECLNSCSTLIEPFPRRQALTTSCSGPAIWEKPSTNLQ